MYRRGGFVLAVLEDRFFRPSSKKNNKLWFIPNLLHLYSSS
jgi:hypothetical protein